MFDESAMMVINGCVMYKVLPRDQLLLSYKTHTYGNTTVAAGCLLSESSFPCPGIWGVLYHINCCG